MEEKRFYILGIALFFSFLNGCYASNLSHNSTIIPGSGHTTTVITHYTPPHTAAHGYQHSYYNHELQFNTDFGVYLVIGNPGLYFYNGHYMRFYGDGWQISSRLNNPWHPAHQNDIPYQLRRHHARQQHRDEIPGHGYRRHHQGHELSYDSHTGAYIIAKRPGIYFYNNRYLRHHRGGWLSANKLDGAWRPAKKHHVSEKLMQIIHSKKDRHVKRKRHKNQNQGIWY